jgi:hypothetical protein
VALLAPGLQILILKNERVLKVIQEVVIMETSLISTFAGLSIVLGLLVGFGTLSVIRGVFTFLMFIGLVRPVNYYGLHLHIAQECIS